MTTYPYEWDILEWDEKPQQTNKTQTNKYSNYNQTVNQPFSKHGSIFQFTKVTGNKS